MLILTSFIGFVQKPNTLKSGQMGATLLGDLLIFFFLHASHNKSTVIKIWNFILSYMAVSLHV